jgi:hypothetical protein
MTHEEFKTQLESMPDLELADKAQSALSKLCATGAKSFTMSVPPRLDDTDMLFSELIRRIKLRGYEWEAKSISSKNFQSEYES